MQDTRILYVIAKYALLASAVICFIYTQCLVAEICNFIVILISAFGFLSVRAMLNDNDGASDKVSDCIGKILKF